METNDAVKTALLQEAERGIELLMEQLQTLPEGDLQGLEQHILTTYLSLGRKGLELVLHQQATGTSSPSRREGSCGHRQRLVSTRPKQVLSLLGKITIHRGYYQCLPPHGLEEEVGSSCSHGEAPLDTIWGTDQKAHDARSAKIGELFGSEPDAGRNGASL